MRTTITKLLREMVGAVSLPEPIYEFGACEVEAHQHRGCHIRDILAGKRYVGCDMRPGPGVDELHDLHQLDLPDESVGMALLIDTIEHVREPWRAMAELRRCVRPGGLIVMTSHMFFPRHAYPDDYWRFTGSGFASLLSGFDIIAVEECGLTKLPHTVLGVAAKGTADPVVRQALRDSVSAWKKRGANSWKELGMALLPPVLLCPAYDALNFALRGINALDRGRRGVSPTPVTNGAMHASAVRRATNGATNGATLQHKARDLSHTEQDAYTP